MKKLSDIIFDCVLFAAIISSYTCTAVLMIGIVYRFIIDVAIPPGSMIIATAAAAIGTGLSVIFVKLKQLGHADEPG